MTAVAIACAVVGAVLVVIGRHRRSRDGAARTNAPLLAGIFLAAFGLSYLTRWLW